MKRRHFALGMTASAALLGCQRYDAIHGMPRSALLRMAGELLCVPIESTYLSADTSYMLSALAPAGILLLPRNIDELGQTQDLATALRAASPSPIFLCTDQEGGSVSRLAYDVRLPSAMALSAANDPNLAYEYGRELGMELRRSGIDTNLAPVLDIAPMQSSLGTRTLGDNVKHIIDIASPLIRGMGSTGVRVIAKHFPGYGRSAANPEREIVEISTSERTLREDDFQVFQAAARAGAQGVMTANAIYGSIDQVPASMSKPLNRELRMILGHGQMIISDSLSMGSVRKILPVGEAAVAVIASGADCAMVGSIEDTPPAAEAIANALRSGEISPTRYASARARTRAFRAARTSFLPGDSGNPGLEEIAADVAARSLTAHRISELRDRNYIVVRFGNGQPTALAGELATLLGNDTRVISVPSDPGNDDSPALIGTGRTCLVMLDNSQADNNQREYTVALALRTSLGLLALGDPRQLLGMSHLPWIATYGATGAQIAALANALRRALPVRGRMPIAGLS